MYICKIRKRKRFPIYLLCKLYYLFVNFFCVRNTKFSERIGYLLILDGCWFCRTTNDIVGIKRAR